jgi:hypothetical protein
MQPDLVGQRARGLSVEPEQPHEARQVDRFGKFPSAVEKYVNSSIRPRNSLQVNCSTATKLI